MMVGQKVGTRKRKGGSNKPSTEGRHVVRSRVLQPLLIPFSSTVSSSHAVAGTSDQGREGRLPVCDRDLQSSFAPVSYEIPSCTYVSDQSTPPWPLFSQFSQIQPSPGFIIPEASQLINNYPCPQRESQQGKENMPPTYPQRSKPAPDILVFARLPFLDSKVTRCYGCGNSLKPEGTNPHILETLC